MTQLQVRQIRSVIGAKRIHRDTIRALGLKRVGDTVVKEDRPEIRGMIEAIPHLIEVKEV